MQTLLALLFCFVLAAAQSTFSPARPPSIPLAVKSPYLTTWLNAGSDGGDGGYLAGEWASFWTSKITAWSGMIRVDGTTYIWMGAPLPQAGLATASQTAFTYTSTRSTFTFDVDGKVTLNATFLSPLYPNDQMRQSLLFSYLDVAVESADGASHDVQLYTDISAEWISGSNDNIAQWTYGTTGGGNAYHQLFRQTQELFSQVSDQAEWGNWYYSTSDAQDMTYQSGQDAVVRGQFQGQGSLANTQDTNYRAISDDWPVFAFANDLGTITGSASTLYTIGLCQEEAIQFDGASGIVSVPSLWTAYYGSDTDALDFFYGDYGNAVASANSFDAQVASDASASGGDDLVTVTSLAARQAFAGTQLTGTTSKQYLFMKEISSDGNAQTVDVIFPLHPILLYTNPTLLKLLLDPLFENQESGQYPNTYSMHDLGSSYPNATGHPQGNDEYMPLEECGDMLIMTLAYAQRARDTAYLTQHYKILNQWAGYLVQEALIPANQVSTDDFAGALANQTNLALKGIIGIGAMAQIANLTGNTADAANYTSTSRNYINQWYSLSKAAGAKPAHRTLAYGDDSTYSLLYNLYGDAVLNLGLVKQEIYTQQAEFYSTVMNTYGVPLDSRHTYTKGDWEMFTASVSGSSQAKQQLISALASWIGKTPTNLPMTDLYDTISGDYPGITFVDRPPVGGTFAPLIVKT